MCASMEAFFGSTETVATNYVQKRKTRRLNARAMFGGSGLTQSYLGSGGYHRPSSGFVMASGFVAHNARMAESALKQFGSEAISADKQELLSHPSIVALKQTIAEEKPTGGYDRVMGTLLEELRTTQKTLKNLLTEGTMTDQNTYTVVERLTLLEIALDVITSSYPQGVPVSVASEVETLTSDILGMFKALRERREAQYKLAVTKALDARKQAEQFEQFAVGTRPEEQQDAGFTPPGIRNAAGYTPPDQDFSPSVTPEKTGMQKYGPIAALAAGGLAAYLALR